MERLRMEAEQGLTTSYTEGTLLSTSEPTCPGCLLDSAHCSDVTKKPTALLPWAQIWEGESPEGEAWPT
jgi:hypothetical protein